MRRHIVEEIKKQLYARIDEPHRIPAVQASYGGYPKEFKQALDEVEAESQICISRDLLSRTPTKH